MNPVDTVVGVREEDVAGGSGGSGGESVGGRRSALSGIQLGVWMDQMRMPDVPFYNIGMAVRLDGRIDIDLFRRAVSRVCGKYDALRLVFGTDEDGFPHQTALKFIDAPLEVVDYSEYEDADQKAWRFMQDKLSSMFDILGGILWDAWLIRVSGSRYYWLSRFHHLVCDGIGSSIFGNAIVDEYNALLQGGSTAEAPSYLDLVEEENRYLSSPRFERDRAFWSARFPSFPPPVFSRKHPVDAEKISRSGSTSWRLERDRFNRMKAVSSPFGGIVNLFLALIAVHAARTAALEEVVIGMPVHNRTDARRRSTVGMFSSMMPIAVQVSSGMTFSGIMAGIGAELRRCYRHQRLSIAEINRCIGFHDFDRSQLYDITFSYDLFQGDTKMGDIVPKAVRIRHEFEQMPLAVSVNDYHEDEDVVVEFGFNRAYLNEAEVSGMIGRMRTMLDAVLDAPEMPVWQIPLLDSAGRDQVLRGFNDTAVAYPKEALIHELFEQQVVRTPEAVAVQYEDEQLTYAQLNARTNQLAHRLRGLKDEAGAALVVPDARVAICVERSLEMVVGLLGILKSGAAYVPVDPEYPQDRIAYVLQDAGAKVLLTQSHLRDGLPAVEAVVSGSDGSNSGTVHVLLLDDESTYAGEPEENIGRQETGQTSGNLAYVIYTSGSTGLPKGVMNEHRGVVNRLCWMQQAYGLTAEDRVLQKTAFSFDVSVWEFFWTLLNGARLVMARPGGHRDPQYLVETIGQTGITTLHFVPSMLQMFVYALPEGETGCASLQRIVCSGEELPLSLQHACQERLGHAALYNLYGPTEAAIDVTHWTCDAGQQQGYVPIGRPIANTQIYILDAQGQPVPVGVSGEIHIAGDGVARGYLNRPELTAERFVRDPFSEQADARMYRTGDLGRWRSDGAIEYLGRNDFQVKIRGLRIELGEIEARLAALPQVREVVVVAREEGAGDRRLVAYWVSREGLLEQDVPDVEQLRDHLKAELPAYMVPSAFVRLGEMPLTPNGKVDRKALPAPDADALVAQAYEAPQTPTEEMLASIWQELLGVERVGRNDNFFDLGGHSLLAVQLLARIRRELGQEVALRTLFEAPTVAEVAGRLQTADEALVAPMERADRQGRLALSWSQQRLWFLEQLENLGDAYHMSGALRLEGELDVDALRRTLDAIVCRHEVLRTVFVKAEDDAEPVQVVKPAAGFDLACVDLSGKALSGNREEALQQALNHANAQRFDLSNGPLIRGVLLRLGGQEHVLFVSMHHIVSDGWSIGVLTREIATLYAGFQQKEADPVQRLPALPVQYADYAQWQRQWLTGERLGEQLAFWKEYLSGAPALLELPTDHPRPALQSYRGALIGVELDAALARQLRALGQRHGATLFMVLQLGWAILMSRLSGQEDVVLGTPVANRRRSELEGLIGFFVNTLALRTRIDAAQTVSEQLQSIRKQTLGAFSHQDVPFEQVVEVVRPERSLSHSPVFQVMFGLENTPEREFELQGLRLAQHKLDRASSQFDLSLSVRESEAGLSAELEYCTDLFEQETMQRWLGYWQRLLESMVADETQPVGELAWLPQAERDLVLMGFNDTAVAYPQEVLIHELFEQQVKRTPEAVAVQYEDERLTYAQLNGLANRLAHRLRGLKDEAGAALVGPDARVAICVERSLEMVVGLLGILKAGAAYVPVDPEYPQDRIAYVLQDAGAKVLLTQGHLRDGLPSLEAATSGSTGSSAEPTHEQSQEPSQRQQGATVSGIASSNDGISSEAVHVLLLDDESTYAGEPDENIGRQETGQTSGNLAYVIYTSGSTGLPKGVMNEHRAVVNRLCWMPEGFRIGVEDRVLQKTAFGFDVSVWEFFWTLLNGARLVMAQPGGHRDPQYLIRTITEQGITMVDFVPSMLQVFLDGLPQGACTSVRHVFSGGEELSLPLQRLCQQKLPASRLHHMYGPTEAAVDATHWACDATQQQGRVPIGRPIANTQIYILDGQGQPVPVGVSGEIHIAGDGVARGYLNRPELTAERFVRDPFSEDADARMYRTGDLGRWRSDGAIEYLGRNDFQVKIRGLRIELGEIEAKLLEQPQVREAVVLAREDGAGDRRLVAYVTARVDGASAGDAGQALDVEVLREQLKAVLPGYMVPSAFVVLQEMPLTPNGKVDRKALPAPDLSALQTGAYEAPRDELQEFIASVWGRVLGIDRVGINDNFFDAGGNSLSLIRVHDMLETRLKSGLSVVDLFQYPTILSLSEHIHVLKESGGASQSGRGMKTDPNQGREPRRSVLRKRKQHA